MIFPHIFPSFENWSDIATLYSETFFFDKKSNKHQKEGGSAKENCPPRRGFKMITFPSQSNPLPQT